MKKAVILTIAAVLVVTSLVSGVFAAYQTSIDNVSDGSFVAKNFVFTSDGTEAFDSTLKIAPGETLTDTFSVMNYEGESVSETNMQVTLNYTLTSEIEPLTIKITNNATSEVITLSKENISDSNVVEITTGKNTVTFTVEVIWADSDNDIDYINKTASFKISAVAVQQ